MLDVQRFEYQLELAQKALALTMERRIPPTAPVFEVLVNHFGAHNEQLSQEVEDALSSAPDRVEEKLCTIYDGWFGPEALHKGLSRIQKGLNSEIAEMSVHVSDSLRGNQKLAHNMRESIRDLAAQVTKEDIRTICKSITASNRLHLASTQSMSLQLERTQFQLGEMQKELNILRKKSSTDHLTGLPNRRYLDEKLNALVVSGAPFCFAIIDLDHFKEVNDNWGHSAGDNILRRLGEMLRSNTKGKDTACRIGGEEFGLVLPETSLHGAQRLCEMIATEFREINWISQSTDEEIGML
ncbi:MAG: GGDEF domain-containing protein, partial [Pseudomonadota bacterium]